MVKLLRIICIDGFVSCQSSQKPGYSYDCPILEMVLEAAPASHNELVKVYQTTVLLAIMKHLECGNEDVEVTLKDVQPFHKSIVGFNVFCRRVVDKLWLGYFVKPSGYIYNFLKGLVEQALLKPKVLLLNELFSSLNRVILYQLSAIPETEVEQKDLVEILCLLSSHAHVIFDETNTDLTFLQCLLHQLLSMVFFEGQLAVSSSDVQEPSIPIDSVYISITASSLLKSGANRLWSKMLELKRDALEQILGIPLPVSPTKGTVG